MNRAEYYAAHRRTRTAARELALRDADPRSATERFTHQGHFAMIFATREAKRLPDGGWAVTGRPAGIVIRTLADRPLRARAAQELAHVGECRQAAASWRLHPAIRALRLREAHRTIAIVRDLFSAFNRLPA